MNVVAASTRIELSRIPRRTGWKKLRTGMGSIAGKTLGAHLDSTALTTTTVLSTGYCGALAGHLKANDVVLADSIDGGGGAHSLSKELVDRVAEKLRHEGVRAHRGTIVYRPEVVASGVAKRVLHDRTGALAVDTESGPLADTVSAHGGELVVVRIVLDSRDAELPFSVSSSPARSALRHPLAAARIIRGAERAAAAIGRTVPLVQQAMEGGNG